METFSSEADGTYRPCGQAHTAIRGPRGSSARAVDGSKVAILDAAGNVSARFPTYPATSLAFLSNGNLVVASPVKAGVLHVYGPTGKLLKSFGPLKGFDKSNEAQNLFLHRGKVLVDASDNISSLTGSRRGATATATNFVTARRSTALTTKASGAGRTMYSWFRVLKQP